MSEIASISRNFLLSDSTKDLVCGSLAGMSGKLLEHPFDTVKVRLQTQTHIAGDRIFNGPLDCFRKTIKREGFLGLYQGLPSPMLGAMFETSALFFVYHRSVKFLSDGADHPSLATAFLAGSVSGSVAALVLTPLELIKCRVQVENIRSSSVVSSVSTWSTVKSVLRRGGMRSLYQGFGLTFLRECGGSSLWFGTYELMCRLQLNGLRYLTTPDSECNLNKKHLGPFQLMFAGSTAGVAFNASFFPADVLKSVQQTDLGRSSLAMIARQVYQSHNGLKGFYTGMGVTLVRAIPANALIFIIYEQLSYLWETRLR